MKKTITRFYILCAIALALMLGVMFIPDAGAKYYDGFEFTCNQEHYILEEDGYIFYEADAVWEDNTLVSMKARYNNNTMQINSKVGYSDPKFTMNSPLTCTQFESKSFTEFSPEIEVVDPVIQENLELKKENTELAEQFKSLTEQVKAIMEILESFNNLK